MRQSAGGIVGSTYRTGKVVFMVMEADPYPANRVSRQYGRILDIESGRLVAVSYRGILIPNLTVRGGVVRLTTVVVGGKVLSSPKAISETLGITAAYTPYPLEEI